MKYLEKEMKIPNQENSITFSEIWLIDGDTHDSSAFDYHFKQPGLGSGFDSKD